MCSGPHKRTTLTTGGKRDRQKPKPNRKPWFFLQNLPKPTDSKIFETVTTLKIAPSLLLMTTRNQVWSNNGDIANDLE